MLRHASPRSITPLICKYSFKKLRIRNIYLHHTYSYFYCHNCFIVFCTRIILFDLFSSLIHRDSCYTRVFLKKCCGLFGQFFSYSFSALMTEFTEWLMEKHRLDIFNCKLISLHNLFGGLFWAEDEFIKMFPSVYKWKFRVYVKIGHSCK